MEIKYKQLDPETQKAHDSWLERRMRLALLKKDELPPDILTKIPFENTGNVEFYTFPPEEVSLLKQIRDNYPKAFQCYTD